MFDSLFLYLRYSSNSLGSPDLQSLVVVLFHFLYMRSRFEIELIIPDVIQGVINSVTFRKLICIQHACIIYTSLQNIDYGFEAYGHVIAFIYPLSQQFTEVTKIILAEIVSYFFSSI